MSFLNSNCTCYAIFTNKYIVTIVRLFLGCFFIWASWNKIIHPEEFAKMVNNYRLLPDFAVNLFAVILPWIEFVVGLLLIIGFQIRSSAFIIICLLSMFIIVIGISIARGVDIECGCFGTKGGRKIGLSTLIYDIFLLAMGLQVFFCSRSRPQCKTKGEGG